MEFIGERVRLLDQSLDRLTKLGFINATVEHRGNPVTVMLPYYTVHNITEKGYHALGISKFLK